MSQGTTINLSNDTLEELRCFVCKGYLSCSPVRLLPSGNCLCGSCSLLTTDVPVYRFLPFEALLSKMSFPCIYKKHGCGEMLLFGQAVDHESTCFYKPFACPANRFAVCEWEGTTSQLFEHFGNEHPDYIKDNAEFELVVAKDARGILMAAEDFAPFIVKYSYDANKNILQYNVRFCAEKNRLEVFLKVRLVNASDPECNVNLKTSECLQYDQSFYETQTAEVLDLSKFLEYLGQPSSIVIVIKLKLIKSDNNITPADNGRVNFGLINTLRCDKCQNYLVAPLFNLDGHAVCCDCTKGNSSCTPSEDKNLLKLVNAAIYPCRWRDCSFEGPSNSYKEHERSCQFRFYRCVYSDCNAIFKLAAAANHLQSHTHGHDQYVSGTVTYKTSFSQSYKSRDIITIKNNRIIVVEHQMVNANTPFTHRIFLYTSDDDFAALTGSVEFEHEHCKLKSKEFIVKLGQGLDVTLKGLPSCFKEEDKLLVTVKLNA